MKRTSSPNIPSGFYWIVGVTALILVLVFVIPQVFATTYSRSAPEKEEVKEDVPTVVPQAEGHVPTPEAVKGIYMSQCVVGTPSIRDSMVKFVDESDVNAIVIDIKDYTGTIGFPTDHPLLSDAAMLTCGARDMKEFVKTLHDKNIYVIGRITVFQDPHYSSRHADLAVQSKARPGQPWKDNKGLNFVDVSSRPFWEYIVALSHESYAIGFDELNYDYVRYPSDGPMDDAQYVNPNRAEALERFFAYLYAQVHPTGVVMSADVFGMAASNTDDLGIGQVLERALPYFDFIMPMVYPSHYPKGFNGLGNPNDYPYEIIKYAMDRAVTRTIAPDTSVRTLEGKPIMKTEVIPATATTATTTREVATGRYTKDVYEATKIRPWLQDFDYGKSYLPSDILAQTKATYDAGLTSWIFWDPSNKYDSLRAVMAE